MRGLAGGEARLGSLDAVVDGVAHQVHQRIADLLEHGLVELGAVAGEAQLDLLAEALAQVAHQARKAVEHEADGQHAHAHDAFLQLAHVALELAQGVAQLVGLAAFERRRELAQHRLRDHQLADRVQQLVDLLDADADRAAVAAQPRRRGGRGRRRRLRRRPWERRGLFGGAAPVRCDGAVRRGLARARRRRGRRHAGAAAGRTEGFEIQIALAFDPVEHRTDRGFLDGADRPRCATTAGILRDRARRSGGTHLASTRISQGASVASSRSRRNGSLPLRSSLGPGHEMDAPAAAQFLGRRRAAAAHEASAPRTAGAVAAHPPASAMISSISACSAATRALSIGCLACVAPSISRIRSQERSSVSTSAGVDAALAAAQLVEQRLERVRERGDVGEAEGRAAALDRMRDAEDGVDQLEVGVTRRELEQRGLHRVERLDALGEEGVVELREIERHAGHARALEQRARRRARGSPHRAPASAPSTT